MASTWGTSWGTSWGNSWGSTSVVIPPTIPAEVPSGGFAYNWLFRSGHKKKKEPEPELTQDEQQSARVAIEQVVADHWGEKLTQLERRIKKELHRERLEIRQESEFRAYLEQERARQEVLRARIDKLDTEVAEVQRKARNLRLAALLMNMD